MSMKLGMASRRGKVVADSEVPKPDRFPAELFTLILFDAKKTRIIAVYTPHMGYPLDDLLQQLHCFGWCAGFGFPAWRKGTRCEL